MGVPPGTKVEVEIERTHNGAPIVGTRRTAIAEEGAVLTPEAFTDGKGALTPGVYRYRARYATGIPGQRWSDWSTIKTGEAAEASPPDETDEVYDEPTATAVDWRSAMTCCEQPDPAILEKNNRLFCRNCRRYLNPEAREEDDGRDDSEGGDAGGGDGPGDR